MAESKKGTENATCICYRKKENWFYEIITTAVIKKEYTTITAKYVNDTINRNKKKQKKNRKGYIFYHASYCEYA